MGFAMNCNWPFDNKSKASHMLSRKGYGITCPDPVTWPHQFLLNCEIDVSKSAQTGRPIAPARPRPIDRESIESIEQDLLASHRL